MILCNLLAVLWFDLLCFALLAGAGGEGGGWRGAACFSACLLAEQRFPLSYLHD